MDELDQTLLSRWHDHRDATAFAELVRRHAAMVHATCRRIVGEAALADDVTQDCFLRLARPDGRTVTRVAAWLHRVATNAARSARRRRRPTTDVVPVVDAATPVSHAAWHELEARIDAAIDALPAPHRALVVGHFLEGRSQAELARETGIPPRTVASRLARAVDDIRRALRRAGLDAAPALLATQLEVLVAPPAPRSVLRQLGRIALAEPSLLATGGGLAVAIAGSAKTVALAATVLVFAIGLAFVVARELPDRPDPDAPTTVHTPPDATVSAPATAADPAARVAVDDAHVSTAVESPAPAQLVGVVRDAQARPIAGADVVIVEYASVDHPRNLAKAAPLGGTRRTTRTETDGRFAIPHVPSRRAVVTATARGHASATAHVAVSGASYVTSPEITLTLAAGNLLAGRLVGPDGAPVDDAIVELVNVWSPADFADGSGCAATDAAGEFRIGVGADAVACTVWAHSARHGSDLFVAVPTDVFADLRWHTRTTLIGRVADRTLGPPGLRIEVRATPDDPPIPVLRTGFRVPWVTTVPVADDGTYRCEMLQPGLEYEVRAVAEDTAMRPFGFGNAVPTQPLESFVAIAGAVVERDVVLIVPIEIDGRVATAIAGRPVPSTAIEVWKDGVRLRDAFTQSGDDGRFTLRLTHGAGLYEFRAIPRGAVHRTGQGTLERRLSHGERTELVVTVPDPAVIPIRVLDADGRPVDAVRTSCALRTPDGRGASIGDSMQLDADGRGTITLYVAGAAVELTVTRFPSGPSATLGLPDLASGARLPETVFTLPRE